MLFYWISWYHFPHVICMWCYICLNFTTHVINFSWIFSEFLQSLLQGAFSLEHRHRIKRLASVSSDTAWVVNPLHVSDGWFLNKHQLTYLLACCREHSLDIYAWREWAVSSLFEYYVYDIKYFDHKKFIRNFANFDE